jgi:hypothetical protein
MAYTVMFLKVAVGYYLSTPVTQKHGDYIMNLDQRCEHKNLKCDKQVKACN